MMARRLLYLPLTVNEIKRHFGSISRTSKESETTSALFSFSNSANLPASSQESLAATSTQSASITSTHVTWFTCKVNEEGLILPLHLPIGLLYDLVSCFNKESNLPWKLEFHISSSSPSPTLSNDSNLLAQVVNYTAFPDESHLSSFYFSNLKEADHLRSGSARNVMNLSRSEQLQLWESVKGSEFDRFWRINQKLITPGNAKNIPIKFWICQRGAFKITKLQFPIQANLKTLKDLLISEFSEKFVQEQLHEICLHGIQIPLTIELDELNFNWNYSDNFINILLIL